MKPYLCQGLSVDADEALSALAVSHGGGGLLATKGLHRLDRFFAIGHLEQTHGSISPKPG